MTCKNKGEIALRVVTLGRLVRYNQGKAGSDEEEGLAPCSAGRALRAGCDQTRVIGTADCRSKTEI